MDKQQAIFREVDVLTWAKPGRVSGGNGLNWLIEVVQCIASKPRLEEAMHTALAAAKHLCNAERVYAFIEHQGHKDEPVSLYKSLPALPEAVIRELVSKLECIGQTPSTATISTAPSILFPLFSRTRCMGAIFLEGNLVGCLPEAKRAMLHLLATQTAIVLDNLILSHNEWTQLPNLSAVKPQVAEALRVATGPVALLFIDIDNFKRVNSLVGYFGGAELLAQFAQRLERIAAIQRSLLAHISGDEFVFALVHMPEGRRNAQQAARAIKQTLKAPFFIRGRSLSVSVSIGASVFPEDAQTASDLFEHAARAAQLAKRAGKGCFRLFRRSTHGAGAYRKPRSY